MYEPEYTGPAGAPDLSYPHIAERLFGVPLLMEPGKVEAIAWALRDRMGLRNVTQPDAEFIEAAGPGLSGAEFDRQAGYGIAGGVAVIPVRGTLVNRGAWVGSYSGMTSYEGLATQVELAAADQRVSAVMLDINSRGGEASGVDDLAASIRELDGTKPVYAMIDGSGSSAAYWIASAARQVWSARSSNGGSIGVVITHYDMTAAAEQQGVTVTHIHAGAQKVLGSPFRALSDQDRATLQAKVDDTYRDFVEAVAGYRGLTTEDVRATEAGVFAGKEMVGMGLADGVTTGRRLLAAIQADINSPQPDSVAGFSSGASRATTNHDGGNPMDGNKEKGGAAEAATYTQAEVDDLLTEATAEGRAAGAAESEQGVVSARAEERARIKSILACDEAAERPGFAQHLALETDTAAEDAQAMLAVAGVETQPTGRTPLSMAMEGQSPNVSDDDGSADSEQDEVTAAANAILNAEG